MAIGPSNNAPKSIYRAREGRSELAMQGEGHSLDARPIDPDTLVRQIEGSNAIEGIKPSGEIRRFLFPDRPQDAGPAVGGLVVPCRPGRMPS